MYSSRLACARVPNEASEVMQTLSRRRRHSDLMLGGGSGWPCRRPVLAIGLLVSIISLAACASAPPLHVSRRPVLSPPDTDIGARVVIAAIPVPQIDLPVSQGGLSGRYEHCELYCSVVGLHPDGTFEYTPRVLAIKYPALSGHYTCLGGGLLFATTSDQAKLPRVAATREPALKSTLITVRDATSHVPLLDAGVSIECEGMAAGIPTNELGRSAFRSCLPVARLEVKKCGYEPAVIEVTDPLANFFTVWLQPEGPYLRGQYWFVADGQLLFVSGPPLRQVQ